jgi:acetyltransferase-like isoleucine patch superfamily enzyme
MRSIIKKVIVFLFSFINKFFKFLKLNSLKRISKLIYTFFITSDFLEFGKNSIVDYPINLKGGKYISVSENVSIGKNTILNAWDHYKGERFNPIINIGEKTSIGEWCHLTSINRIEIGKNVLFGRFVLVTDNSHGGVTKKYLDCAPSSRALVSKGAVVIEDNVWIGDKVTILANVKIGHNSIIGANSVVTKDIPPYTVVGGIPAKVIQKL